MLCADFILFCCPQRSCGKVMFLHLSVTLFTRGVCHTDTPLGRSPPGRHPPCAVHAGIRATSGWYASYWNAILFRLYLCNKKACWLVVKKYTSFVANIMMKGLASVLKVLVNEVKNKRIPTTRFLKVRCFYTLEKPERHFLDWNKCRIQKLDIVKYSVYLVCVLRIYHGAQNACQSKS